MRAYLQSQGYIVLRWNEWCEDHAEFEVIAPWGECIVADSEWQLLATRAPQLVLAHAA